jgi:hypothetical protein
MDQQGANFSGWALVELMGHQREAGYVTTQYFGDKAMFQIDVPEIPSRQETLTRPQWSERDADGLLPAGTVVEKAAIPGRTRLVNPSAVYALNPATEEAVRAAVASSERREIKVLSLPEGKQLVAALPGEDDDQDDDEPDTDEY